MSDFDPDNEAVEWFPPQPSFFVLWVLLNVIGQLILEFAFLESGLGNSLLLFNVYIELWSFQWFVAWIGNGLISGIITGLIIGGLQWFLLQKYFAWANKWLIFSIIGWVLVDLWSGFISPFMWATSAIYLWFIGSVITGAILGTMQWLVLRQYVYQAGWWIVANSLAWLVSSILFFVVVQTGIVNTYTPFAWVNRINNVISQIIKETIPGLCLFWLLRNKLIEDFGE